MEFEELIETLKENNYKITPQRKAIIQALIENRFNLVSTQVLYTRSKELYTKTNMSTVYRNLDILEKLNMIYKVNDEDTSLYKLKCKHEGHHHHLICKKCGKTEAIDFCPMETLQELSNEKGFQLEDHKLEIYGTCKQCRKDSSKI